MSSPLDGKFDPDEPTLYAPKWVRDAAQSDRRTTKPGAFEHADHPSVMPLGPYEGAVIERYRAPRPLEPTIITVPSYRAVPKRIGTLTRFGGAAAIAAGIALLLVGKWPFSWLTVQDHSEQMPAFGSRFAGLAANGSTNAVADQPKPAVPQIVVGHGAPHGQGEAAPLGVALGTASSGAMMAIDGLPTGAELNIGRSTGSSGWRLMTSDFPEALVRPPEASVGAMDLAIALRLADDSVADRKTVHLEWTAPVAATVTTPATKPGFVFRNLDRDEIDALVKRGKDFVASGDLAAARLLLQRAAEGGDAGAALTLAGTYDPLVLEKLGAQGLSPDIAKARAWYEWAKEFGSIEAPRRLEMLASRDH